MTVFREEARAKINLTLRVLGRRPDGYHSLQSLVAFADLADAVLLDTGKPPSLTVSGPFAAGLMGVNLLEKTHAAVMARFPGALSGHVHLEKNLPVAAGIGGGSADAGALLRALAKANPGLAKASEWLELAATIGADVPVCFTNKAAWMSGLGEIIHASREPLPEVAVVIANPMVEVAQDKTARVFKILQARPQMSDAADASWRHEPRTLGDLVSLIGSVGNDLTLAAFAVVPAARETLAALEAAPSCRVAGLSGAGPTCFGLFETPGQAEAAALRLRERHPGWWIGAAKLS